MPDRRHQPRPSSAQWHPGLLASLRADIAAGGEDRTGPETVVGAVTANPERGPGWFRAGVLQPGEFERIDDAVLVTADATRRYRVLEAASEDDVVHVRVQPAAPDDGLSLALPWLDPARYPQDLLRGLEGPATARAVQPFARGVLDRLPPVEAGSSPHQRAVGAARAAGLQIVWAPPSTGSTEVIVDSLVGAMLAGQRCLFVTADPRVVETVVDGLIAARPLRAGEVVRVGQPVVLGVTADSAGLAEADRPARTEVGLAALVRAQQPELTARIDEQHRRVVELRLAPSRVALQDARRRLADFDPEDHAARTGRLANADRLAALTEQTRSAEAEWSSLSERLSAVEIELATVAEARQRARLTEAQTDLGTAQAERDALGGGLGGWRPRRRASAAVRQADQAVSSQQHSLDALLAGTTDPADVLGSTVPTSETGTSLVADREALRVQVEQARSRLAGHREARERLLTLAEPQRDDAEVCRRVEEAGLPELAALLPSLQAEARGADERLELAGAELEALQDRARADSPAVEAGVLDRAAVVATTLARLISSRPLVRRRYDLVIVDRASSAALPEVVFAAAQAARSCVLFGDHLQQGPVVTAEHHDDHYWDHDVFEHFGLTSARAAQHHPGCVLLDTTTRFGPKIVDYLNAIAYQGVLNRAPDDHHREADSELVWIDVDGLPSTLTTVQTDGADDRAGGPVRRSWAAGARVAAAVAETHRALGHSVGVLTPYPEQAALIAAQTGGGVVVGTAAELQSRTFDVLVFDTVEDGRGWIAQARRDATGPWSDWCRDGLRVVDVALTRARRSVYLIASGRALRGDPGTPMGELLQLCASGVVPRVPARRVLEPEDASATGDVGVDDQGDRAVVDQ